MHLCMSGPVSVGMSLHVCMYVCTSMSVYMSPCLSVCMYLCLYLIMFLSVCMCIYLSPMEFQARRDELRCPFFRGEIEEPFPCQRNHWWSTVAACLCNFQTVACLYDLPLKVFLPSFPTLCSYHSKTSWWDFCLFRISPLSPEIKLLYHTCV